MQQGSHQLILKHRVCCAERVHGAKRGTQTGRQYVNGGGGRPVGAPHLVLLKSGLVKVTGKVTGTQLHGRLLRKSGTCTDICKWHSLCVCVHSSREWASQKGTGLSEPLKSCDQVSDTLVFTCYSSRMGAANSISSIELEQMQNQALAVIFPPPS